MDYSTKSPIELSKQALAKAPALLAQWRKPGRPTAVGSDSCGFGWHELPSSQYAGSHASSAGLVLITDPLIPLCEAERTSWVSDVAIGVLKPFLERSADSSAVADDRDRLLEAQRCSVKVANFISACAALGRSEIFSAVFEQLRPLAHSYVEGVMLSLSDGGWGHWLCDGEDEGKRAFPTAAIFDALYRFARVDSSIQERVAPAVTHFAEGVMTDFGRLLAQHDDQPPPIELWRLLPALQCIAEMDEGWMSSAPGHFRPTRQNFERLFNAYIRHELFAFGLNQTDDFQKYRHDGKPSGTDYVAFNSTACLTRAILSAVETGKLHPGYAEWTAPHLCTWAEQLCSAELPVPARFSYVFQTLSCLLAAIDLDCQKHCVPNEIRMNIYPRVFSEHSFARKPQQGFYVTPFEFPEEWKMKKASDALFIDFRAACREFSGGLELVRGDHSKMGVITERIWQYINESEFIIALCVGANANVYYEIGVAHTLGKPVLLVGRKGEADFKFDIAGVHHRDLEVSEFDLKQIQPIVTEFLSKVYGAVSA